MWREGAAQVADRERLRHAAPVRDALLELARLAEHSAEVLPPRIAQAGALCAEHIRAGGKILACGNGGSAADAQHFVGELIGRMGLERAALPALSLCVDPAVVTCIANDYGYDRLFARQVEGLGRPGDVLVALSTSGRSPNVLDALDVARARGLVTIALVGARPNPRLEACDVLIDVPSTQTARVQEIHTAALHAICDVVERTLF